MENNAFNFGVSLASVANGVANPTDIFVKKAAQDILDTSYEMQQLWCRAGANALTLAGEGDSIECRVLCKCASADRLLTKETHDAYIKPVQHAFAKQAKVGLAEALASGGAKLVSSFPGLAAALALGAGAAGGAGIWGLQHAALTDDAETEAKFAQAKRYRQIANRIKEEMALRNAGISSANAVSSDLY